MLKKGDANMRKTRKALSIVLSVLIVLASMPMMYTATTAAGTIDNPTLPVSESGEYNQSETNNLAFLLRSLKYVFYQTTDDEYFKLNQTVTTDKYCGSANMSNTVNVNLSFELSDTDTATSSFFSNTAATLSWAGADSTSSATAFPSSFPMEGSYWGTTDYNYVSTLIFKGASASSVGQQNYSFVQNLDYSVSILNSDGVLQSENSYSTPITTEITVVDARAFVNALAHAQSVVANPGSYSQAYVSANQAALNDIPADLKNLSAVYSQSVVDSYANLLASIPEDCADYTEFNTVYAESKAFVNDGTYSAQSYEKYLVRVEEVNKNLAKNLSAAQQTTVDTAVLELENAKDLLVIEFAGTGATTQSDIEDITAVIGNEFNLIQVKDDQILGFTQPWTIYRGSKSSNRMFYVTLDTTDANTAAFVPRFTEDCVETGASIISGGFEGTLTNQAIFTNWQEVDANGNAKADVEAIKDGRIDANYAGFQSETQYYFRNNLSFKGLSASESGAKTFTYVQKFYVNWTSWAFGTVNHYNSTTYSTTINITDARALAKAYSDAQSSLANPGLHSAGYIEELQKIVNSVPQDMVNGTKYYTQAEVDAYYQQFAVLSESKADYSAFDAAYQRIEAILANPSAYSGATITAAQNAKAQADAFDKNLFDSVSNRQKIADMAATLNAVADSAEGKANYDTYNQYIDICHGMNPAQYTGDAYNEFMEVVESVESTLPLDLGTSQQAQVDEACNTLLNAYLKLTGGSITEPDSVGSPFTQDAITGEYTNGVVKFTINYPEYNFTQTLNDEKVSITTELTISSADSSKVVNLTSLKISSLDSSELANLDTAGNCYNDAAVTINNAENLFIVPNLQYNVVQGVELLLDANGNQYADANGDMAWFNTWQNTAGVPLSTDGVINESTTLTTEASSATAEFTFASAGGGDTETRMRSYTYVLRLAWTEDGVEHHAHIPVTFNITDARSLRSTYYSYMNFINAGNDGTYTAESFQAAADIMASVNTDVVSGNGFFTQEEINAENAKLGQALASLQTKASYSAFNDAKSAVEAIVNAPAGTYTDATITAAQNALTEVGSLDMDLASSEQATVDAATAKLQAVLDAAQEKVDYTDFDAAKDALEEIVKAPEGTYTDETVQKAEDALNEANKVDPDLPKDENGVNQGIVDDAAQNMQDVVNSAEKKADYTDYNNAKSEADSLVNDDGNGNPIYNEDAFNAYKDAVGEVDTALNKDLSDADQAIVDKATSDLADLKETLENNKLADYEEFNQLKDILEEIVNAPEGTYTDETVKNAQDALDAANQIPADMVVGENNANQDIIDEATQNMKDVIDSVEEKADYTEFDKVVDELENIVNNPDDYTSDTVDKAQDALDNIVAGTDKDLPSTEQDALDEITSNLQDVVDSAVKKADYTDYNNAKSEADSLVNDDGNGNPIYNEDAFNAYKEAVDEVDTALNKDLSDADQAIVDNATSDLADLKATLENNKNADYTDFNAAKDALEEIVNNPDKYTSETVENAQAALDEANKVPADMVVGENNVNQETIDAATDAMQNVIDSVKEKADYSKLDDAYNAAQDIVNAPEGTYTEETVKNAQDAIDAADALNKDLEKNDENQAIIDEVVKNLEDSVANAEEKADYTEFDKVVDALEEIVNAPEGTYTEETVKNAQDALDNIVAGTDKDLPVSEQPTLDEITSNLQDVVDSAKEKADYTDYNNAKTEADSLVNDDGNGNPIYDEDAFNAYKDAVNSVDTALDKDLSKDDQAIVDDATTALEDLKATLEEKKIYKVTFIGLNGEVLAEIEYVNGSVFGTIAAPELPESTDLSAYVGWLNADVLMNAESVLEGDVTLVVAEEYKKLIAEDESTVSIGDEYVTGIKDDTTVSQLKAELQNDEVTVEIRDYEGNLLADDALVGTGATITLKSKYTDVVYEVKTVIVYGDVDGDGDVDVDDRTKVSEVAVDNDSFDAEHPYFFLAADVCNDGYINALDGWMVNLIANEKREVLTVA